MHLLESFDTNLFALIDQELDSLRANDERRRQDAVWVAARPQPLFGSTNSHFRCPLSSRVSIKLSLFKMTCGRFVFHLQHPRAHCPACPALGHSHLSLSSIFFEQDISKLRRDVKVAFEDMTSQMNRSVALQQSCHLSSLVR